ncbi:MAG: HYR domain-containing protein [Saprospiraceae bacterium]
MPILTQFPITLRLVGRLFPFLSLLVLTVPLSAQCVLICNQGLQISLDPAGKALVTWPMIAPEADNTCPGPLTVTLVNHVGQPLPNPLTCAQIGLTVTAKVKHTASGNSCNGTVEVIDALPPVLSNCADKFIFCNDDPSPEAVGVPTAADNCTPANDVAFFHFDTETPLGCGVFQNGKQVLKRIDREWTVTDNFGNSSTCLQRVWLKHIAMADVEFPLNHDNFALPALVCGQDPEDLDLAGQPMVNGIPVGASPECEIGVTYTDQIINHCAPAGFTVVRNWTAIDFCAGNLVNRIQTIKVEDTEPPDLTAPDNVTVGTDGFYCTGSVTLPQAVFTDNCSAVTVLPSWQYGSGYGPFVGVPEGNHLVTYIATDACGNDASATMTVTVVDSGPPQAICASDLQVSVSSNGAGYVYAVTVGAGSFDNCSPVVLSISRDEENFLPQILVTCADQGTPIPITLKVTDAAGLENFCQMEVTVRDFLKPTVQCPPNLTLTCLQDYTNLGLTGQATASDNCALKSLTHQDVLNIQPCNIGSVTRWWMATDSAANTKSCSQKITLSVLNTTTVTFPANASVNGCGSPASLLPPATGEPTIGGLACSALSVNYADHVFSIAPPSCFRIFRDWKVVDHCIYDPNGGSAGVWEHTQLIDVVDTSPPALGIPPDVTVGADPFDCMGLVNLADATATDCSSQITRSHDSPFSGAGNTNNASGQYPHGVHFVTFTATDGCGNSAQQTLRITVEDSTPPTAVCLTGISANIQASDSVTLNAKAFDGGCFDFCSPQNTLVYSIAPSRFDCQQIGFHPVVLTVQDTAGNTGSCNTQVLIKDDNQFCGGGDVEYQVDGTIRTESGLPVRNIPVALTSGGFAENTACDTLGYFVFDKILAGTTDTLKPYNNANWLNGVTTFDLVLISKHILSLDTLESPYRIISADANRSGSITTFDIVQLRKIILGILDSVPNNTSWRFVDSTFVFPNLQNPFASAFPEQIVIASLDSNRLGQNFVGLKVGDVNANTNPAEARAPRDTLFLNLPARDFYFGESLAVPVFLENWTTLEGLQFELKIDPSKADLEWVEFAQPDILAQPNMALREGGLLSVSWDNAEGAAAHRSRLLNLGRLLNLEGLVNVSAQAGAKLFTLHLRAKADADVRSAVKISSTRLLPEAYRVGNEARAAIALRFAGEGSKFQNAELDIFPNPSAGDFFVKNPFAGAFCQMRVLDSRGQTVWQQDGFLPETVAVQNAFLRQQGLYLVELRSADGAMMGKAVRIGEK